MLHNVDMHCSLQKKDIDYIMSDKILDMFLYKRHIF